MSGALIDWNENYFPPFRCSGLVLLETYSSLDVAELEKGLPPFLRDVVNVTGKPEYSMFNLSLRDESYDAKFYKYAAHGNKQQPPQPLSSLMCSSSSPLKNGYTQTSPRSNGPLDRPLSCSLSSASQSPVPSPTSDDVLLALTSNALKWANVQGGSDPAAAVAVAKSSSNGFHSSSITGSCSSSNGGANGENAAKNGINNGKSKNGHAHLD